MKTELKRIAHNETLDEQPVPIVSSEAIDFRASSESLKKKIRLIPQESESSELDLSKSADSVGTIDRATKKAN